MTIKEILLEKREKDIEIKGWVISNRGNNKIRFIIINDGSTFDNIQVVVKDKEAEKLDAIKIGASIHVKGKIKLTPNSKQELELISKSTNILKNSTEDYPLQKQGMSKETLREIPHLRHRTNLFRSVMRIRSTLFQEIHSFFKEKNFLYVTSPIITSNDGEGAGESFIVDSPEGEFFGKKATLGVTGQLQAEAYAQGFKNVYTFAPTFRAEHSHTKRHAAEFWMLEPEMAFSTKEDAISLSDDLLKVVISKTLAANKEEFEFLNKFVDDTLLKRLDKFLKSKIKVITYENAIKELQKHKDKFDEKNIKFGIDLGTEHEKFLCEEIFKGPVAVTDYPKEIKAFYMKMNDDNKTVGAFDVLVPGVGEMIGGSERESNKDKLISRMKELKIPTEDMEWYLEIRDFGYDESTGFGLGFERLIMYVTGIENIRDSIPFPRTPNNLKM